MNITTWNEARLNRVQNCMSRMQNINRAHLWDYQRHYRLARYAQYYESQIYAEQYELLRDKRQQEGNAKS